MPQSTHTRAFIIGEALIDAVHDRSGAVSEHPGGSPANVALTLGRLGQKAQLLSWFGQDSFGSIIEEWLSTSHVEVAPNTQNAKQTSVAHAHIQQDGSAQYQFDVEWDVPHGSFVPDTYNVVHTGSIAAVLQPGGPKVENLISTARKFATITYDPNARPTLMGDPGVTRNIMESYVALSDVIKVSDEDLEWLYPGVDPLDIAQQWQEAGAAIVIVTRGGAGATAFAHCGQVDIITPKVTVVDTVGAGDSFMGALIYGLGQQDLLGKNGRAALKTISRATLETVLDQCARVAAVTVSRAGANPPWLHELS